jgi:ligand-binding SRPBCC domain-containing protein
MARCTLPVCSGERRVSRYVLRRRQVVPGDLESVFTFFESPRNLEEITPPWLRFEVVHTTDESMRLGTEIEYRLTWQHLRMKWKSRIAEYEPAGSFADEMIQGPYSRWYHRHLFRSVTGGVEMEDIVDYRLPLGPLGRLTHRALIRRQLEAIFDYRREAIESRFGTASPAIRRAVS